MKSVGSTANLALLQPQAYRLLAAGGALTSGARPRRIGPWTTGFRRRCVCRRAGRPMGCCRACWRRRPASPAQRTRRSGRRCTLGRGRCGSTEPATVRAFRPLRNLRERRKRLWRRWRKRLGTDGTPRCGLKALNAALLRALSAASGRAAPRLAYASIRRQAALKFGEGTAQRLAGLLDSLTAQDNLDRVGDWILECSKRRRAAVPRVRLTTEQVEGHLNFRRPYSGCDTSITNTLIRRFSSGVNLAQARRSAGNDAASLGLRPFGDRLQNTCPNQNTK